MISPSPTRTATLVRSGAVGVVATLMDLALLSLLVDGLAWTKAAANLPALTLGLAAQFFGNKYFAFNARGGDLLRQGGLFALVEAGAFILNALAFHLLAVVGGAHHLLSRLLGSALVYFIYSFPLWGVVFRAPSSPGDRS